MYSLELPLEPSNPSELYNLSHSTWEWKRSGESLLTNFKIYLLNQDVVAKRSYHEIFFWGAGGEDHSQIRVRYRATHIMTLIWLSDSYLLCFSCQFLITASISYKMLISVFHTSVVTLAFAQELTVLDLWCTLPPMNLL